MEVAGGIFQQTMWLMTGTPKTLKNPWSFIFPFKMAIDCLNNQLPAETPLPPRWLSWTAPASFAPRTTPCQKTGPFLNLKIFSFTLPFWYDFLARNIVTLFRFDWVLFFPLRKESQSFSNIYGVYCILHESTITCMGMAQAFFCQDKLQSSTKLKGSATHLPFSCPCPENWPVFWDSYLIVLTPSHHCSDIATGGRYNSSRNTKTLGDASNFQFKSTRI